MFDSIYKINLYKSKINPSNYLEIFTESLESVISLDLINLTIEFLVNEANLVSIDKFLLICLNKLTTNIRFQHIFVKSKYQDILKHPISYNIFNKFQQIIEITEKQIAIRSDNFYNYILYKKYSNDHKNDLFFDKENLSMLDMNIYKNYLEYVYEYNSTDNKFVSHANKLNVCINKKNIKENYSCINNDSLKTLLIAINTNTDEDKYSNLEYYDFNNNIEYEETLISFVKSLLNKDIYSLKKVYNIYEIIQPTKKLLFAYFAFLYLTYSKYTNKYIKDTILNIVSFKDFSSISQMILEFYIGHVTPHNDLDSYFAPLSEFIDFNYCSHIHLIYPLLYYKYNIVIDKYNHYIKAHSIISGTEKCNDIKLNVKEISMCLLYGYFDFKKSKMLIKNNITSILNIIRQEYINNNVNSCIFEILKYLSNNLEVKISDNVWDYFRALGCKTCKDECNNFRINNLFDKIEKTNKNAYNVFVSILNNAQNKFELIKNFVKKFESDIDFQSKIRDLYGKLPQSILDIVGHIKFEKSLEMLYKLQISSNPLDYFKDNFIEELKTEPEDMYNEALDVLFHNAISNISTKNIDTFEIRQIKNYKKFLIAFNNILLCQWADDKNVTENTIYSLFSYTEIFTTKILEFTAVNMLCRVKNELVIKLLHEILEDKINCRIIKFITECNFKCDLNINFELLIESCKLIDDFYYIIYLVEQQLFSNNEEYLYNTLQQAFYKIKDYERVQGINCMFVKPSKANLYYEFRIEKENEKIDFDLYEQFKIIEDDFSEWKNINMEDNLGRHFVVDCELVENDIHNLDIVTRRRRISADTSLLKLHELMYFSLLKQLKTKNSDLNSGCSENDATESSKLELLNSFYFTVKRDIISCLLTDKKYDKAVEQVIPLIENKEWSFYHDLGEVYIKAGNKSKAKECFKRVLNIFNKEDAMYLKSLVKYLELVNSKDFFAKNIEYVKNISRVWFLYGKLTDQIEFYINSLLIDGEYKYECVPRVFHALGDISDKRKLNKAFKLVLQFLEQKHLKLLLLPFYNQIICKINNSLLNGFINKIIVSLMLDYKEVYWSSIYFINDINTDGLDIDNKLYLSKIKKMRDILYEISTTQKITDVKKDFPGICLCIGMHVPNKYPVIIQDIEGTVLIYRSLQAPKRICFLGDDGKKYYFLCKYKDDLRKDSRFVEVCKLINKLFSTGSCTNTSYYIRTYEVIPCFHNFGLIEYIEGLISIKNIAVQYYDNLSVVAKKYSVKKKIGLKDFKNVLSLFSPILDKYIRSQTTDPYHWYQVRNNYVLTCGIMNIVGWFMGLGDRHTENILLDSKSFDVVHVDLNCIFDKGKSCSIPELVPFRLTQNIINGFGALGLHGTYNNTCISTLDLLQTNRSIIISNLLSFVYDPLHEWNKKEATGKKIIDSLSDKIQDGDTISKIEDLNDEAMNQNNLSNMYIGWLSFI